MSEFKVGDEVEVIQLFHGFFDKIGHRAKILRIDENDDPWLENENGFDYCIDPANLKLFCRKASTETSRRKAAAIVRKNLAALNKAIEKAKKTGINVKHNGSEIEMTYQPATPKIKKY